MEHDFDPSREHDEEGSEERTGYGNPPKHTRWPSGYFPNPRGRPRKANGRKAILDRIANERCEVKVGGKLMVMTRAEVVLIAVRNATANGDATAQKLFHKLLQEICDEAPPIPKGTLITGEKLTDEEWDKEYGHLGGNGPLPAPKPIRMVHIRHLLKNVPPNFADEEG